MFIRPSSTSKSDHILLLPLVSFSDIDIGVFNLFALLLLWSETQEERI